MFQDFFQNNAPKNVSLFFYLNKTNICCSISNGTLIYRFKDESDDDENEYDEDGNKKEADTNNMNAKYPGYNLMKSYAIKNINRSSAPNPVDCIIGMINMQLKVSHFYVELKNFSS